MAAQMSSRRGKHMNGLYQNYSTTTDLKAIVNIVDFIGEVVSLTRKGNRYWGLCPFHGEKTPSFSVDPSKQSYYCFGCHERGDAFDFARLYYGLPDFTTARDFVAARTGVTVDLSADARRSIAAAKAKRAAEAEAEKEIENLIRLARTDAKNLEGWINVILRHIYSEKDLDRPAVVWALQNQSYIEALCDDLFSGTPADQIQAVANFRGWRQRQDATLML